MVLFLSALAAAVEPDGSPVSIGILQRYNAPSGAFGKGRSVSAAV
jgi:hypothetical protein